MEVSMLSAGVARGRHVSRWSLVDLLGLDPVLRAEEDGGGGAGAVAW